MVAIMEGEAKLCPAYCNDDKELVGGCSRYTPRETGGAAILFSTLASEGAMLAPGAAQVDAQCARRRLGASSSMELMTRG